MKPQSIIQILLVCILFMTITGCTMTTGPTTVSATPDGASDQSNVASQVATQAAATVSAVRTADAASAAAEAAAEATNLPQATAETNSFPPTAVEALPPTEPPTQASATLTPTVDLTQAESCELKSCVYPGTFLLARPINSPGRNTIVPSERFGTYQNAANGALHGVFFLNSTGTPVLAAADGEVVVAGDDNKDIFGLNRNMYGNLVILKHELPGVSKRVFTLYGHLSQVLVKKGDLVTAGQEIGKVGSTGRVNGSTLRFEVRVGKNVYEDAVNPELWLAPLKDRDGEPTGAIAGRIINSKEEFIRVPNILIERLSDSGRALNQYYLKSYGDQDLMGADPWEESFALGDLPAGRYQISFLYFGVQAYVVEVQPGKLTRVVFQAP